MSRYIFKNGNVFYQGKLQRLDVLVVDTKVEKIEENIVDDMAKCIDLDGKLLTHGFIDIHTHLREPGFEYKETIASGTKSALYGGFSHVVAMANTKPCMDDVETVTLFEDLVSKNAMVHTYTYSAITTNLVGEELVDMDSISKKDIVLGFSDDGRGVQNDVMMEAAMKKAKELDSIIVAHCEDENELVEGGCINQGPYATENKLVGINNESEYKQVARDLELVKQIGNRYHVCHVSTRQTVDLLKNAIDNGMLVSGEVSPHHLVLTEDNIKNCDPNYKMNPPLRSKEDREALINGLNNGTLSVIATDHAPHSDDEKAKAIDKAPFGILGLQHCFPLIYTYVVKTNETTLETVLKAMTEGPAAVLKMPIEFKVGCDANISVFDLDEKFIIEKDDIVSLSNNTPFIGYECYGKIKYSMIDGMLKEF